MKWVSVKDAMPAAGECVLTTGVSVRYISKKPYRWYEIACLDEKNVFRDDDGNVMNALHWMRIEPPEGEPAYTDEG